jgi:hypothetical protein
MMAGKKNLPNIRAVMVSTRPFRRASWGQWLALVLAGAMLLQYGPVRVLVQVAGQVGAEKTCRHHAKQKVCPRNPDGPCTCTHHDTQDHSSKSGSPEGPVIEACDGKGPSTLSPSLSPLAWTPVATIRPAPRISTSAYAQFATSLSPQRVGDDVFRPPRTTPDVRLT